MAGSPEYTLHTIHYTVVCLWTRKRFADKTIGQMSQVSQSQGFPLTQGYGLYTTGCLQPELHGVWKQSGWTDHAILKLQIWTLTKFQTLHQIFDLLYVNRTFCQDPMVLLHFLRVGVKRYFVHIRNRGRRVSEFGTFTFFVQLWSCWWIKCIFGPTRSSSTRAIISCILVGDDFQWSDVPFVKFKNIQY